MEPLVELDPNYPKAKYCLAPEGEGDVKSPAYERIGMRDGQAVRIVEFHKYQTRIVHDKKEEKALGPEWVDSVKELKG